MRKINHNTKNGHARKVKLNWQWCVRTAHVSVHITRVHNCSTLHGTVWACSHFYSQQPPQLFIRCVLQRTDRMSVPQNITKLKLGTFCCKFASRGQSHKQFLQNLAWGMESQLCTLMPKINCCGFQNVGLQLSKSSEVVIFSINLPQRDISP